MKLRTGDRFVHWRGQVYEFVTQAVHTETLELLAVYRSVLAPRDAPVHTRPWDEFFGRTADGRPRFRRVTDDVDDLLSAKSFTWECGT